MLLRLWNYLQGKKTNIVALATLLYEALGLLLHFTTWGQAEPYIVAALLALGFRSALTKLQ